MPAYFLKNFKYPLEGNGWRRGKSKLLNVSCAVVDEPEEVIDIVETLFDLESESARKFR